jgi:hypothetical protein
MAKRVIIPIYLWNYFIVFQWISVYGLNDPCYYKKAPVEVLRSSRRFTNKMTRLINENPHSVPYVDGNIPDSNDELTASSTEELLDRLTAVILANSAAGGENEDYSREEIEVFLRNAADSAYRARTSDASAIMSQCRFFYELDRAHMSHRCDIIEEISFGPTGKMIIVPQARSFCVLAFNRSVSDYSDAVHANDKRLYQVGRFKTAKSRCYTAKFSPVDGSYMVAAGEDSKIYWFYQTSQARKRD